MSQPRVTVTVGRSGQRSATITSDKLFSDRTGSIVGNRKRSVKDRLGEGTEGLGYTPPYIPTKKRQCQEATWKPRVFTDGNMTRSTIHSLPNFREDLRLKLNHKIFLKRRQNLNGSNNLVNELPERISVPSHSQGSRVVLRRQPIPLKSIPVVRTLPAAAAVASRIRAVQSIPVALEQLTVGTLLQSLGLSKYSIMFQAEEVDMTALRNMTDDDLKELGLPMGPRKKILQALSSRK